MQLTLHASLLRKILVNFWALLNFIWKYVLLIDLVISRDNSLSLIFMDIFTLSLLRRWVCAEVSCFYLSDNVEKSAVVCQWVKNSHVQLPFVDFWVEVQRGILSFLEIISLPLFKNQCIDLARARSEALVNKSCNAKRERQWKWHQDQ